MKKIHLIHCFALAAALSASGPQLAAAPAPPAAKAQPSKDTLMQAVFGSRYRPDGETLADLPTLEDRKKVRRYALTPLATELLPSGEMVLLAQAIFADERGDEGEAVLNGPLVNVFLLRETGGKWVVVKRHHNIVYRGYGTRPGSVLFTRLGQDRHGLAIATVNLDEGCNSGVLHLYDLQDTPLRDLAGMTNLQTDTPDCNGIGMKQASSVTSTWHLAPPKVAGALYDDLVMVFKTEKFGKAATKVSARYAYDGKTYRLVAGANPLQDGQ